MMHGAPPRSCAPHLDKRSSFMLLRQGAAGAPNQWPNTCMHSSQFFMPLSNVHIWGNAYIKPKHYAGGQKKIVTQS